MAYRLENLDCNKHVKPLDLASICNTICILCNQRMRLLCCYYWKLKLHDYFCSWTVVCKCCIHLLRFLMYFACHAGERHSPFPLFFCVCSDVLADHLEQLYVYWKVILDLSLKLSWSCIIRNLKHFFHDCAGESWLARSLFVIEGYILVCIENLAHFGSFTDDFDLSRPYYSLDSCCPIKNILEMVTHSWHS